MVAMKERSRGVGAADGLAFALTIGLAAFLGRENPDFRYPEIFWSFLALLVFNLVNYSILVRFMEDGRRMGLAVGANTLLLTVVIHFSGGARSYLWVLYLLPLLHGCLAFGRRGILSTTVAVVSAIVVFHSGSVLRGALSELLEMLTKAGIMVFATDLVMRVSLRERKAREQLAREQRRIHEERTAARERLQHMDRLATLGTITAGVVHELKTPLTNILGYSDLIAAGGVGAPPAQLSGNIAKAVRRCERILQDTLSFSRAKESPAAPADLNALIRECVELKKYEWLHSGISVEESYAPDLPPVVLKGPQFQQVLFNLLTNAEQALRLGGVKDAVVRVSTARADGAVLVTVSDNGPGVPPALKDKIWETFFTTKPGKEGTGLGLSICRRIVTELGGAIELDASGRGRGAAFIVGLPVGD